MKKILFQESQKNIQVLAIVPAVLVTILFGILSFMQIILHKQMGNNPAPNWLLLLFFLGSPLMLYLFSSQTLKTLITEDEIIVSFGFFTSKRVVNINEISNLSVRKYDALKEFLGWGVRTNGENNCYTVKGNDGLEISLSNGKRILIGTKKPIEIQNIINDNFLTKFKK